jgi:hypothetical protein
MNFEIARWRAMAADLPSPDPRNVLFACAARNVPLRRSSYHLLLLAAISLHTLQSLAFPIRIRHTGTLSPFQRKVKSKCRHAASLPAEPARVPLPVPYHRLDSWLPALGGTR